MDRGKADRIVRAIKIACAALIAICFLGIVGGGVCERVAMTSPDHVDIEFGRTAPIGFKDQIRFVTPTTAAYCRLSVWIMLGAAGGVIVCSAVLYFGFGRLPHE